MFDIVFIFFLFLIGVTCVLYYLPPKVKKPFRSRYRAGDEDDVIINEEESSFIVKSQSRYSFSDSATGEKFTKCCKYCEKCKTIYQEVYSERILTPTSSPSTPASSSSCYLKAKDCDIKNCKGPVYEV
jgi:hypothetical protein